MLFFDLPLTLRTRFARLCVMSFCAGKLGVALLLGELNNACVVNNSFSASLLFSLIKVKRK